MRTPKKLAWEAVVRLAFTPSTAHPSIWNDLWTQRIVKAAQLMNAATYSLELDISDLKMQNARLQERNKRLEAENKVLIERLGNKPPSSA